MKKEHGMCKINTIYDMNIKMDVANLCRKFINGTEYTEILFIVVE